MLTTISFPAAVGEGAPPPPLGLVVAETNPP